MARVYSGGECKGMGATCRRHVDHPSYVPKTQCKKQMTFGNPPMSEDECIRRLKEWLLQGLYIERLAIGGRNLHVTTNARDASRPPRSEAELDQLLQDRLAEMRRTGMEI